MALLLMITLSCGTHAEQAEVVPAPDPSATCCAYTDEFGTHRTMLDPCVGSHGQNHHMESGPACTQCCCVFPGEPAGDRFSNLTVEMCHDLMGRCISDVSLCK